MPKTEYIKREDALKKAVEESVGEDEYTNYKWIVYVKDLNAIPSADVVEVVRCKDCANNGANCHESVFCNITHDYNHKDFFCKDMKRNDGDEHV